jgi:hypothetical protein
MLFARSRRLTGMGFDSALAELFRAPHAEFVATRKRLAGELAARGDVDGAARLVKLARPSLSAWVVNQLWWRSRAAFETLIESAALLQDGDSRGGNPYRDAMTKLRTRATTVLEDAGHAASEQMLRRITSSLAAIATTGGFAPDAPGALLADRDPHAGSAHGDVTVAVRAPTAGGGDGDDRDDHHDDDARTPMPEPLGARARPPAPPPPAARPKPRVVNGRVHPHVEMHDDDQQTHVVTERALLEAALATARTTIEASEREREQLQRRLAEVEHAIHQARTIVRDVETRLTPDRDDS